MTMARARNPFFGKPHILMGGVALVYVPDCWIPGNALRNILECAI